MRGAHFGETPADRHQAESAARSQPMVSHEIRPGMIHDDASRAGSAEQLVLRTAQDRYPPPDRPRVTEATCAGRRSPRWAAG